MGEDKRGKKKKESERCSGFQRSEVFFPPVPTGFDNQGCALFLPGPFPVHGVRADESPVKTSNNLILVLTDSFTTRERKSVINMAWLCLKTPIASHVKYCSRRHKTTTVLLRK